MKFKFKFASLIPIAVLGCFAVAGCGRSALEVRSYDVAKTSPAQTIGAAPVDGSMPDNAGSGSSMSSPDSLPPAMPSGDIAWSAPAGWQAQPASSMRAASFAVPGKGDASIVILGGEAGGMAANVNRWRGQIGLSPSDESEIQRVAKVVKGPNGEFRWFKLLGEAGQSMLAAIIVRPDRSIFVKLTANPRVIEENQEKFLKLCKSIKVSTP